MTSLIERLRQRGANNDTKRVASDCIDLTQDCNDHDETRNKKKACHELLFEIATHNTNDLLRRYMNGDIPAIRSFLYRKRPSVMCFQEVWIPCGYRGSYPAGIADHGALPKKIRAAKWPNETKQFDELHQASYPSGEDLVQLLVGDDYRPIVSLSASRRQGSIVAVRRDISQPSYVVFNYVDAETCAQDKFGCCIPAGPIPYNKKYKEGHHPEGRIVVLGFALFDLVCTYTVWSGVTNPSKREEWDRQMYLFVTRAKIRGRNIVWIGDLNIAPTPVDVSHPSEMMDIPGFTPPERQRFHTIERDGDLCDAFRACHPRPLSDSTIIIENNGDIDQAHYTWRNVSASHPQARGMRLDHALVTKSLLPLVKGCEIIGTANMSEFFGSDHCPLVLSLAAGAMQP